MSTNTRDASQQSGKGEFFVPPVVLKAEGLVKIYGKRRVVDGVDFYVNQGEIVGLIGPNGAGKTTSFRIACGLLESNGGSVFLNGKDVTSWPMYRRSREGGMGFLPQDKSIFASLSVQNNLLGVMELLGMDSKTRHRKCNELLEKFKLTYLRKNAAGGLSGGERRRLEVARALINDPKIILLDEPFAALDPIAIDSIRTIIKQLVVQDGISILVTDHSVQHMLAIIDRSYVISAGRVLCHGTTEEVLSNPEAREVYFGENSHEYASKYTNNSNPMHGFSNITDEPPDPIRPALNELEKLAESTLDSLDKIPSALRSKEPEEHVPRFPRDRSDDSERGVPRRPMTQIPIRPIVRSIDPKKDE